MAEAQGEITPSLAEQYLLKDKDEKLDVVQKPADVKEPENTVTATAAAAVEAVKEAAEATIAAVTPSEESSDTTAPEEKAEDASAAAEESSESAATEENSEPAATEAAEASTEATEESPEEEAPEIKIETAPADFRFPTTNQTRHCFTRYVEYHRCIAAKGDGAPECDKFAKYYRSLCPGEWVDKWNEQRENGTFPGPL